MSTIKHVYIHIINKTHKLANYLVDCEKNNDQPKGE